MRHYVETSWVVRKSLPSIAAMLGLGFLTRYSGIDATIAAAAPGWVGKAGEILRYVCRAGRPGMQRNQAHPFTAMVAGG